MCPVRSARCAKTIGPLRYVDRLPTESRLMLPKRTNIITFFVFELRGSEQKVVTRLSPCGVAGIIRSIVPAIVLPVGDKDMTQSITQSRCHEVDGPVYGGLGARLGVGS